MFVCIFANLPVARYSIGFHIPVLTSIRLFFRLFLLAKSLRFRCSLLSLTVLSARNWRMSMKRITSINLCVQKRLWFGLSRKDYWWSLAAVHKTFETPKAPLLEKHLPNWLRDFKASPVWSVLPCLSSVSFLFHRLLCFFFSVTSSSLCNCCVHRVDDLVRILSWYCPCTN